MASSNDPLTSRRGLIRTAAKLAVAAPLALAIVPGVAFAKDHDDDIDDDNDGRHGPRGRALGINCRPNANLGDQFNGASTSLPLVGVGAANNGGDFAANSAGNDGLGSGAVLVNGSRQVVVLLRGAVANAGYDVQFVRLHDDGREDLGTITTDTNGNFNGNAPNTLGGGGSRVGAFVLIRNGADEYVSAWP
jgi:hypothetical protein